jgi:hypothetical protein
VLKIGTFSLFFSCFGHNLDTVSEFWPKLVYVAKQSGKKNMKKETTS